MANRSNRRQTESNAAPVAEICEPDVHRWPHPIPQSYVPAPTETTLQYIHCALSYQNELLSEIKTLLEKIAVDHTDEEN